MTISVDAMFAGARPKYAFNKTVTTAEGAGTWESLWRVSGNPTAGAVPPAYNSGSGYVPTSATTGSLGQTNSAQQLRLNGMSAASSVAGTLILYDRLWACSGMTTNAITTLNVTTPGSLPTGRLRDGSSDYSDVEAWIEFYTAPGATGGNWTLTYVDGAGSAGATAVYVHPANAETVGQMMPFPMSASAAPGVQQVTSLGFSAASGSAGSVGITLLRRLATIPMLVANVEGYKNALDLALERVRDDACLALMVMCSTTSTGIIQGHVGMSDVTP